MNAPMYTFIDANQSNAAFAAAQHMTRFGACCRGHTKEKKTKGNSNKPFSFSLPEIHKAPFTKFSPTLA